MPPLHRAGSRASLRPAWEYAAAAVIVSATAALGVLLRAHLTTIDMAMLLLLAVVFVASRLRPGPALAAAVLSIFAFNFAFVPPFYTLHVSDTAYLLTFAVMLVVATTMSRLTARIRADALDADARARAAVTISGITQDLAGAASPAELLDAAARHIGAIAGGEASIHLSERGPDGAPLLPPTGALADVAAHVVATWAAHTGQIAGPGTGRFEDAGLLIVPLASDAGPVGVGVATFPTDRAAISPADTEVLAALGRQVGAALERHALDARHEAARVEIEGERLRTALLSSLSHDLRTPLASIEGAASTLLQAATLPHADRQELAQTILGESRRMTSLVMNLLNMVRVEAGSLAVRREWQPLEESLGVALLRLDETLREYPVTVDLPPDLPLVPIDGLLIEQVFINLLENAAQHCPSGTPITVSAHRRNGGVEVTVADLGPGIAPGSEEAIFDKFHRSPASPANHPAGAGLGLTICRGIIMAHGGRIWADPPDGSGAAFHFLLPLSGLPAAGTPAEAAESPAGDT